jgi:hypothetical protein
MQILREVFPLVSIPRIGVVQDRLRRRGFSSIKEIIDIDDEDTGVKIHLAVTSESTTRAVATNVRLAALRRFA